MRVRTAHHVAFFILPAMQFYQGHKAGLYGDWPWQFVIWWGHWGIQLEGT